MPKIKADLLAYIQSQYGVDLDPAQIESVAETIHNTVLSAYFSSHGDWKPGMDGYGPSGWALVDAVNALNPTRVLDVGCGYNLLKDRIPHLWGIDPYNDHADEQVSLEEFRCEPVTWDVILCLGSINFGCEEKIRAELAKVTALASPSAHVFFRVNPGLDHGKASSRWIDFYPWDEARIRAFADEFGWSVEDIQPDQNRLYFVWKR